MYNKRKRGLMKKSLILLVLVWLLVSCGNEEMEKENERVEDSSEEYSIFFSDDLLESKGFAVGDKVYIKADDLFGHMGYEALESANKAYRNGREMISFNREVVSKNDLVIDQYNDYLLIDNVLYINNKLVEKLLGVSVEIEGKNVRIEPISDWTKYPLIAHAMGNVGGKLATNSREAFYYSYQNGYRLFECDLILTSDQKLVARHDWSAERYKEFMQGDLKGALSLSEVKSKLIYNKYHALDFKDIALLMSEFRDVYLVTDTKELDFETVTLQFELITSIAKQVDESILDRIIPQFYTPGVYRTIHDIYPFRSYIFTLYLTDMKKEEIRDFALEHEVRVITMPYTLATKENVTFLKDNGLITYVHTLNGMMDVKQYLKMGIQGFYTDFILPSYFELEK